MLQKHDPIDSKDKSCCYMEMGSKVQTTKDILQEKKISEFIIDETQIKFAKEYFLDIDSYRINRKSSSWNQISAERIISVAERFLHYLINEYRKHPRLTDVSTMV
jgi:hypothetical protein